MEACLEPTPANLINVVSCSRFFKPRRDGMFLRAAALALRDQWAAADKPRGLRGAMRFGIMLINITTITQCCGCISS